MQLRRDVDEPQRPARAAGVEPQAGEPVDRRDRRGERARIQHDLDRRATHSRMRLPRTSGFIGQDVAETLDGRGERVLGERGGQGVAAAAVEEAGVPDVPS